MSNGKIIKPSQVSLPDPATRTLQDLVYDIVQTCKVDVDDSGWESSHSSLVAKINSVKELLGKEQLVVSDELNKIKAELSDLRIRKPLDLLVTVHEGKTTDLGFQHQQLPALVKILSVGLNVYLVGPAGSGKTHAAIQCAKALGVPFHFTGAIASEFKLTGFIDAQGRIVSTEFRRAFENGGLFLFDEIDASYPQAVLAFNAALSNDYMDFPDKRAQRHKKFFCIAAANTYGQGADRQYVGRNQLDAASLDRFVFLDWKYDENLEAALAENDDWTTYVQKIRRWIHANGIRHVISPRASINGARLLSAGLSRAEVEAVILWKGMDQATINKIAIGIEPLHAQTATQVGMFTPTVKIGDIIEKEQAVGLLDIQRQYEACREIVLSSHSGEVVEIHKRDYVKLGDVILKVRG